jgi:hypothetical protein
MRFEFTVKTLPGANAWTLPVQVKVAPLLLRG